MKKYILDKYCDLCSAKDVATVEKIIFEQGTEASESKLAEVKFINKLTIVLSSIIFGLIGGDRLLLGDNKRGIAKFTVFFYLLLSLIILFIVSLALLYIRVESLDPNVVHSIIGGKAQEYSLYVFGALIGAYVVFTIIDAFLCYNKAKKINYNMALAALKVD